MQLTDDQQFPWRDFQSKGNRKEKRLNNEPVGKVSPTRKSPPGGGGGREIRSLEYIDCGAEYEVFFQQSRIHIILPVANLFKRVIRWLCDFWECHSK